MATVVYKNAVVLVGGAAIRTSLSDLTAEYKAEMLDDTVMGDDTRSHKGGLLTAQVSGQGFAESGDGMIETVLFGDVGTDDEVVAVFPDGVVEGAQSGSGIGYAMKGVNSGVQIGGSVGALLPIRFTFEARGIGA